MQTNISKFARRYDREFKQNAAALLEDDAGSIRAIWPSPAGPLAGGDGSFSKKVSPPPVEESPWMPPTWRPSGRRFVGGGLLENANPKVSPIP